SFKVAPCHPGDAKLAPQAEAISDRGEEREGQGHAKQPYREPAKMRLVEHGSSPRADYFFGSGIVICLASRGCRSTARTRVLPFAAGFSDTRCRQPVGSSNVSPALSVLAGCSSMAHSYSPSRTYPITGPGWRCGVPAWLGSSVTSTTVALAAF